MRIASPWIDKVSRVDLLKSAGLYVMPDRLFLVRIRKDLFRLSVVGAEAREIRGEDAASRRQALSDGIRSLLPYFDPRRDPPLFQVKVLRPRSPSLSEVKDLGLRQN